MKVTDTYDEDYTAILQMFPYHVDNLTADGTALQKDPNNFTLRTGTSVTYNNTSSSSNTKNLNYKMTAVAETIFALDTPALQSGLKTFQGLRGIVTKVLGKNDVVKKLNNSVDTIWNKIKDTTESTTTKVNTNSRQYTMSMTTAADYQDTLYMNRSTRYFWRYPIQEVPAPAWLLGQTKDTDASFDKSKVKNQLSYITFTMSEPATPTSAVGIQNTYYQPYHELGNLFSYPATLEQTEGYEGRQSLTQSTYGGTVRWDGANFKQDIKLSSTETTQEHTKKSNKLGAITMALSAVDNIFGSNLASIPKGSDSSFTRSVTDGESISVNIPSAYSGARFTALFETYLDVAGTMTSAFAVERFNRDDALWGSNSLYSLKPDPSLLLPEKFSYTPKTNNAADRAVFVGNDNDPTAIKMRGVRFMLTDYEMGSDNLLVKGLKYTISVPVYNASFVDAENFKVRLSYAKNNNYNAAKTTIGEYTFTKLPGWCSGLNRQTATFTWTPDVADGIYCIFAEIDPDNTLDEVHENRRDDSGQIVDYGGNNLGYWRVGVAASDTPIFDRNELRNSGGGVVRASAKTMDDISNMDELVAIFTISADNMALEDFIKQKVDGSDRPVPAEVEVYYESNFIITNVGIKGYTVKPEAVSKDAKELTDDDIGILFVNDDLNLFPNESNKTHFMINPVFLQDGAIFYLNVDGDEIPITSIIRASSQSSTPSDVATVGSAGGGCEAFSGSIAGIAAVLFLFMKARKR